MIDLQQAEAFIEALTGDRTAECVFQVADDDLTRKSRDLTAVLIGTVRGLAGKLSDYNDRGGAIYVQINGGGRGARNVSQLRALFVDDDGKAPLPPLLTLMPAIEVRSSAGDRNRHFYWPLSSGEPVGRFTPAQRQLIAVLQTDKSIHNLDRVMRLPGSMNRKRDPKKGRDGTPFLVQLVTCDPSTKYTIDEVLAAYTPVGDDGRPVTLINPEDKPSAAAMNQAARIEKWLLDQKVGYTKPDPLRFLLHKCCFNPAHLDVLEIRAISPSGAIWAGCYHESCFDDQTEALTRNGFIPFADVTDETEIATRNAEGGIEYHRPQARQRFKYKGTLLHFLGRSVDMCVTPDHALFASCANAPPRRVLAEHARKWCRVTFQRGAAWTGQEVATFTLPEVRGTDGRKLRQNNVGTVPMDAWLALLGWCLAEGCTSTTPRNYTTTISQTKHPRSKIVEIARQVGFHARDDGKGAVIICSKRLYTYLHHLGLQKVRRIPRELLNLSKRQLHILFDALMAGDGHADGDTYTTISKCLADDVQELGIKLGLGTTQTSTETTRAGNATYRVFFGGTTPTIPKENIREVAYDGEVFDVTVPNHVLMVRRNGRVAWSGNCGGNRQSWQRVRDAIGGWASTASGFTRGDHVEIANRMLADLRALAGEPCVFVDGKLRRYSPVTGLWEEITRDEQARIIAGYAGTSVGFKDATLKIQDRDKNGAINYAAHMVGTPFFFSGAPPGIAFTNGFVSVDEEITFVDHAPGNRAAVGLPFPYDPAATAPRWQRFLRECFKPDEDREDKIAFLQEFIGACLVGVATRFQTAAMLVGEGENGKSQFVIPIFELFPGTLRSAVKPQDFGDSKGYMRARLAGVRLNAVTEIPEADILHSETFKAIVTGDPIEARLPYGAPFTMIPQAGHLFAANRLPGTADFTLGFWRRFIVIPWNRRFSPGDPAREEGLGDKMVRTELPGIAAWAIEGARRLLAQHAYTVPPSSRAAMDTWRTEADHVAAFVRDHTQPETDENSPGTPAMVFYAAFRAWTEERGNRPLSAAGLGKRLRSLGIEATHNREGNAYPLKLTNGATPPIWSLGGIEMDELPTTPAPSFAPLGPL